MTEKPFVFAAIRKRRCVLAILVHGCSSTNKTFQRLSCNRFSTIFINPIQLDRQVMAKSQHPSGNFISILRPWDIQCKVYVNMICQNINTSSASKYFKTKGLSCQLVKYNIFVNHYSMIFNVKEIKCFPSVRTPNEYVLTAAMAWVFHKARRSVIPKFSTKNTHKSWNWRWSFPQLMSCLGNTKTVTKHSVPYIYGSWKRFCT